MYCHKNCLQILHDKNHPLCGIILAHSKSYTALKTSKHRQLQFLFPAYFIRLTNLHVSLPACLPTYLIGKAKGHSQPPQQTHQWHVPFGVPMRVCMPLASFIINQLQADFHLHAVKPLIFSYWHFLWAVYLVPQNYLVLTLETFHYCVLLLKDTCNCRCRATLIYKAPCILSSCRCKFQQLFNLQSFLPSENFC